MESSDPANKHIQTLLGDDDLEKVFDLDLMKFSRNYEGSMYLEKLNTGAKVCSLVLDELFLYRLNKIKEKCFDLFNCLQIIFVSIFIHVFIFMLTL